MRKPQEPSGPEAAPESSPGGDRIAKVIARAGICSRREAEALIAAGRVTLDGTPVETPALNVRPSQVVAVDGKPLEPPEPARLWRFHKPAGLLTTTRDPEGRQTIYDRLPAGLPRVMPVGRLDLSSEGLLLLTNDGGLKRHLELPSTGWARRYRVRVHGKVERQDLDRLGRGMTVEGIAYGPVKTTLDNQGPSNAWLTMTLREGKNREIRRLCEALGWQVNRLIRIAYGPFQLGELAEGETREISRRILRDQLGSLLGDTPKTPGGSASKSPKPARKPPRKPSGKPAGKTPASHANRRRKA